MPVGMQTAADALFNMLDFGFPPAGVEGRSPAGVPILIWGGASTVGLATIQLAKVAGFSPIFAVASSRNHDTLKRLGADFCFDYRSSTVIEDVRKSVARSGKVLSTVCDAVGGGLDVFEQSSKTGTIDFTQSTPYLARQCCSNGETEKLRLTCVLPVAQDTTWKFCLGIREYGTATFGFPQDSKFPGRLKTVMDWIVLNHGLLQFMPNITVVHGAAEAVKAMHRVFEGKVSLEKVVIARPL